jgi:hypothetical protein
VVAHRPQQLVDPLAQGGVAGAGFVELGGAGGVADVLAGGFEDGLFGWKIVGHAGRSARAMISGL